MESRIFDISDLVNGASARSQPPAPAMPILEAQRDELRQRLVATPDSTSFETGQFVRQRHGFVTFHQSETTALMFWRYLEESTTDTAILTKCMDETGASVAGPRPDCMIAYMQPGTGITMFVCLSSICLEPDTRPEFQ